MSVGFTYLLGLGWVLTGPILYGSLLSRKKDIPFLEELPLALVSGLIINYGIVVGFQSLKTSLITGCIISIIGIACFIVSIRQQQTWQTLISASTNNKWKWAGAFFVCLLFLGPILSQPLSEWDTRSIWFFHAKMIYAAGTFGQAAGWQNPAVFFSHPDYPNLVPVLAAQVTYMAGLWNEYIPKLSLVFMLVPAVLWLLTFARRSFSFIVLLLLVLFSFNAFFWNGMIDGYLALYFSIAMLLLGRYVGSSQSIDLISSAGCLMLLLYIKNEGALAALIGFCLIVPFFLWKNKSYLTKEIFIKSWKYLLAGILAVLPFVLWSLYKHHWNLSNDLEIGTTTSLVQITTRLKDGSYKLILKGIYEQIESPLLLLGVLYAASVAWKKPFAQASLPAFMAAGIYALGMLTIYLLTPYDLTWQLNSSVSRTMFSVNGCIFIGCYYILNRLEGEQNIQ